MLAADNGSFLRIIFNIIDFHAGNRLPSGPEGRDRYVKCVALIMLYCLIAVKVRSFSMSFSLYAQLLAIKPKLY